MTTQTLFTLFLASPGDVAPERELVSRIVEEYNATVGEANGVRVQVVRWETDARPGWGKDGQQMINKLIEGRDHDLFVVIFWNRFGTPTPRAKSGTLEEFNLAVKSNLRRKRPEIMLYFNTAPATLDTRELDQRKAVLEFKASIQNGLYGTYKGKTAFEKKFRADYGKWLLEAIAALQKPARRSKAKGDAHQPVSPATTAPPKPPAPRVPKAAPQPKGEPILLDGDLFLAEKVVESGANWTIIVRPRDASDDRKIRALGGQNQWHQQFPLVYDLQAGRAQTTKPGERSSDGNGALWTLELRFSPIANSGAHNVNYGEISANDIAQMKAEWLLLSQMPPKKTPTVMWEPHDTWYERQIIGNGKDGQPIFPTLWQLCGADKTKFKTMARLYAVNRLLSEGVCEHIDALEIGAIRAGKVTVTFRGTRASFSSQKSQEITVRGACPLKL